MSWVRVLPPLPASIESFYNGDCGEGVNAPDCGSGTRGFESHQSPHWIAGDSPSGKATDFDSVMRRFESFIPSHEPLAQLVEHLTFNQGVAGSSPAWLTIYGAIAKW
jgi:hypothetical protein